MLRIFNITLSCVFFLAVILLCAATPDGASADQTNQTPAFNDFVSAAQPQTLRETNAGAAHPLLEALILKPGHVNLPAPASVQAPSLSRGCKARFQESTAQPYAALEDRQSRSVPNPSYNHRTFYRNDRLICAETWEGVPENSLLRKVVIPGETVTLEYDDLNRLIKLTRTDTMTGNEPRVTRIHYYAGGRVTMDGPRDDVDDIQHLTVNENGDIIEFIDAAGHRYLSDFDAQGRRIAWEGPNGERREFEYNSRSQIKLERSAPGTAQQISINLEYDEAGRLATSQRTGEDLIGRSYDEAGRLTHISDQSGAQLHLRYGAAGRLQKIVSSRDLGTSINRSLPVGVSEIDPLHPADPRELGRLVPSGLDQPVDYQFDELDRIVAVLTKDGTITRFEYNGFGELRGGPICLDS